MGHSHAAHDAHDMASIIRTEQARYHHFITLALWLAVITAFEVVLIFLPFPEGVILGTLVTLSVVKFFAVITWFMHIVYDRKILFYLFLSGLAIAFATVVALLFIFEPDKVDPKWFPQ